MANRRLGLILDEAVADDTGQQASEDDSGSNTSDHEFINNDSDDDNEKTKSRGSVSGNSDRSAVQSHIRKQPTPSPPLSPTSSDSSTRTLKTVLVGPSCSDQLQQALKLYNQTNADGVDLEFVSTSMEAAVVIGHFAIVTTSSLHHSLPVYPCFEQVWLYSKVRLQLLRLQESCLHSTIHRLGYM